MSLPRITIVLAVFFFVDPVIAQQKARCLPGQKLEIRYDNVIDLEGASNYAYDSVLFHFTGQPGKAVDGARMVMDIYNDSAFYGAGRRKGRKVLVAFPQMAMIDSVRGLDSSHNIVPVNVYLFRKINASNTVHSTYDSILNAHLYKPDYTWNTSGGAQIGYRWLQQNMRDTAMYLLFNFMDAQRMSFEFFGCYLKNGAKENLILPLPDTFSYKYKTIGDLSGSNVTQIASEAFLADTLSWEKPAAYRGTSAAFRFYDHPMYYDISTSNNPRDWKLNMMGAGNLDSLAAVKYGLRSIQSTRGGQGKTVKEAGGSWEVRQTNSLSDNPEIIDNYRRIAKFHTQMTAKKGRNKNISYSRDSLNYFNADTVTFGQNINTGREIGNEDDKDWIPRQTAKPQHLFAKLAAVYDGDRGRMGSKTGVKTMDSTMDVVYPGVIFKTEWIRASITWSKLYYGDRKMPWDVMSFHIAPTSRIFKKSPTANEIVGTKGSFPEYFDDAVRLNNIIKLYTQLIENQARVNFCEYAISQLYDWPRSADQVGWVSTLATPLYGNYDDLRKQKNVAWNSAAINTLRQFLVISETAADGSAGYEFHDNGAYKNALVYRVSDQSNGKYSRVDTVALWPRFWLLNGFVERAKDYRFEAVLLKEAVGGRYVTKYRNVVDSDSVMIVIRKRDTSGAPVNYTLNAGADNKVLKFIPGLKNLRGLQTIIYVGFSGQLSAPADLMPVMYFYRERRKVTTGGSPSDP